MDESMVTIPLKRYEQLLETETRVNVVVEQYMQHKYFYPREVLRTLGTELSVELAKSIAAESQKSTETEE